MNEQREISMRRGNSIVRGTIIDAEEGLVLINGLAKVVRVGQDGWTVAATCPTCATVFTK